ncbi:MAG: hypothetical protein IJ069_12905 [Prevotella sp.]|nr:hypothetical protein [Prevotella sp.]MBQ8716161.1 hypothetical protein [Prevotella sp.]
MKKIGLYVIGAAFLVSSCGTYTGTGAYAGGTIGAVLGSAIGGISGGWRGSDIGTIVGMAGGAAVGAAIGAAADQKRQEEIEGYHRRMEERERQYDYQQQGGYQQNSQSADSGFDATNSGDDRIDIGIAGPKGEKTTTPTTSTTPDRTVRILPIESKPERIIIRNARFIDQNQDGILKAGEQCKVSFEIMNFTRHTLYDVQPMVNDVTGNKNIHISPNLHVESIAPNSGVRYTATILADKKLKDGTVKIKVGATVNNQDIDTDGHEFLIVTRRK